MPKSRLIVEWFFIALLSLGAVYGAIRSGTADRIDWLILDQLNGLAAGDADEDIILVEIEDRSLAQIGAWPWPRTIHAKAIEQLGQAQPKVIGYDVLFTEPTSPGDDEALGRAIADAKTVILPSYVRTPGSDGREADLVSPIAPVLAAAAGTGHVHLNFDDDGIVRRIEPSFEIDGQALPHFMRAALAFSSGRAFVAANQAKNDIVPFRKVGSYRRVPFSSVLNGEVPDDFFRGKTVLVGATAVGMRDSYPVPGPAGGTMSGIEMQANYLDGIKNGGLIRPVSADWLMIGSFVPTLLLLGSFWLVRPTLAFLLSVVVTILVVLASLLTLASAATWIPPAAALVGIIFAYPLWSWRRLSALNSFVEAETASIRSRSSFAGEQGGKGLGFDSVAKSAIRLKSVIGAMEDAKDYMSSVISNAPDALCVVGSDDLIALMNDDARDLFGSDLSGQPVGEALKSLKGTTNDDGSEMILPDGRVFLLNRANFDQDEAQSSGSILRLADITPLRQAAREREQMLEFLSHDMRSPQASIITLINRFKGKAVGDEAMKAIQGHARHTLKLADDFVQLARLSESELELEECDLVSITNEAIDRCYAEAQEKKVSLVRPADDDEHLIMADAWPLLRALTNLIDNAVKYSPPLTKVSCAVSRSPDGRVSVSITDEGEGVPAERQANIFKPYGPSNASKGLSAGLGLSFVKKTVDRLGGDIDYRAGNPGSIFTLTFPGL